MGDVECPVCGVDVSGCAVSVGDDGLTRYTQPVKQADNATGMRYLEGGLVHIVGGQRCLRDAEAYGGPRARQV